jgi:hypothetical protein
MACRCTDAATLVQRMWVLPNCYTENGRTSDSARHVCTGSVQEESGEEKGVTFIDLDRRELSIVRRSCK